VSTLTDFVNLCLAGRVSPIIRLVFYGATLCALAKKGGGVRPIAVGSTLRRLVAKAACRYLKDVVVAKLAPSQLGFGVPLGAEAAAHAARVFVTNSGPGQALVKIDFSNAFITLQRNEMLKTVHSEIPAMYPFFYSCYFVQSICALVISRCSLIRDHMQQGDPLGPLLFCSNVMSIVKTIKSEFNC